MSSSVPPSDIPGFINQQWDDAVVPVLSEYIKVPCQSPDFDPEWATNGLLDQAMDILVDWVKKQTVAGMTMERFKDDAKTPFLYLNIDPFDGKATHPVATADEPTILMYGHMDKQPPLLPWAEGLHPYTPVYKDGRLYGRAGADDGYAVMASLLSIIALQRAGKAHGRICVIIEGSEESSESHLDYYIEKLKSRFGNVSLVVCLDSGALTWDRLWLTSSLRGVVSLSIKAELLKEGIHSGLGGGSVADSMRVLRVLMDRIEDSATGNVKIASANCEIPAQAVQHMQALKEIPHAEFIEQFPLLPGATPESNDNVELALRTYWKPTMTVVGCAGLPPLESAGNVLRQSTTIKVSMRMPPLVKCADVVKDLEVLLKKDVPYGAHVTIDVDDQCDGWAAPILHPWLEQSLTKASQESFGKNFASVGLGGSIPFMGMLGDMFPQAQFVVTGVLGPNSNAHGPNEFLDVPFGKRINTCIVRVLEDHFAHFFGESKK